MSYAVYQQTDRLEQRRRGRRHAAGRPGRPRLRPAATAGRLLQALDRQPDGPGRLASRPTATPAWSRSGNSITPSCPPCKWRPPPGSSATRPRAQIAGLAPRGDDWLEVPGTLPRVRLVTHAVASQDPARDIGQIDVRIDGPDGKPLGAAGRCRPATPAWWPSGPAGWNWPSPRRRGNCWWFPRVTTPAGRRRSTARRSRCCASTATSSAAWSGPAKQTVTLEFHPGKPAPRLARVRRRTGTDRDLPGLRAGPHFRRRSPEEDVL